MRYAGRILLASVLALSACGWAETGEKIKDKKEATDTHFEEAKDPAQERKHDPLTIADEAWYGTQSVRLRKGFPLPKTHEGSKSVALVSAAPLSLQTMANQLSIQTGIPVRLINGADRPLRPIAAPQLTSGGQNNNAASMPAVIGGPGEEQPLPGLPVAYEGPLSGLLDLIASNFGLVWYYDGSAIIFSRYETRTFVLESLPGEQELKDTLSGNDSSDTSSSGGLTEQAKVNVAQTTDSSIKLKFWEEFSTTIATLLNGDGAYTISPSSGTVMVMASPENMTKVAEYIEAENARLGRQVAINVEVYSVDLKDINQYGLDLTAVFKQANLPQFKFMTPASGMDDIGAGLLSATVSGASSGTTLGKFNDSSAIFRALSEVGDVARVAQVPLTTLNNRPASRQIVVNRSYLREVTQTVNNGVSQSSATPGNIQTGITLQLLPRLLTDGRIMLQYSLALRDLVDLRPIAISATQSIQLPETQARVFVQQAVMRSGSTLVLAGFEQKDLSRTRDGLGHPLNWVIGNQTTTDKRTALVIAMTAREVDVKRAGRED